MRHRWPAACPGMGRASRRQTNRARCFRRWYRVRGVFDGRCAGLADPARPRAPHGRGPGRSLLSLAPESAERRPGTPRGHRPWPLPGARAIAMCVRGWLRSTCWIRARAHSTWLAYRPSTQTTAFTSPPVDGGPAPNVKAAHSSPPWDIPSPALGAQDVRTTSRAGRRRHPAPTARAARSLRHSARRCAGRGAAPTARSSRGSGRGATGRRRRARG